MVLLLLIFGAIILRFYSFFPAVMDHDESTYLIIGRDVALGKQLYVDVTDTKPVGIFLIYAFFFKVFGYSIFLTRLVVAAMVGLTSYLVFKSSIVLFKQRNVAFAASVIYLFYTSTWSRLGVTPNAEVYFNLTTITGFLLLLKNKNWSFILSGFVFGLGFMIKYLVMFDCVFLFAFFLFKEFQSGNWKIRNIGILKYLLAIVAFSIPFLATNLYFYLDGNFEAFKYITYVLPSKYGETRNPAMFPLLILDFIGRFLPISFMFFYVVFKRAGFLAKEKRLMFIMWITGIVIAMYLPGKIFPHYSVQLMLPFSLIAALFFHPRLEKSKSLQLVSGKKYGYLILLGIFLLVQVFGISGKIVKNEKPRKVAEYLNNNMESDDSVYLSNYRHIVYYLIKTESPTKYVHPSLLTNPAHAKAFGIDGYNEIRNIIAKKPTWVVVREPYRFMTDLLTENYELVKHFENQQVAVYKLKKGSV